MLSLLALLVAGPVARGFTLDSGPLALSLAIPDDTDTGLAHSLLSNESGPILSLTVSVQLNVPSGSEGWTGDLFVYLKHGSEIAVLLNRPGKSLDRPFGYDDGNTVSVSFSEAAANGDVHSYRLPFTGSHDVPVGGSISGVWQPDGRAVDPFAVLDTTPRTATLSRFQGTNVSGNWTLFVADLSSGGQYQLDRWSIEAVVGPAIIPESDRVGFLAATAVAIAAAWHRRNRQARTTSATPSP